MPLYDYRCDHCGHVIEMARSYDERDSAYCPSCDNWMTRLLAPVRFKFAGRVTPGGGQDRMVADSLGIPIKELPPGLRTPEPRE